LDTDYTIGYVAGSLSVTPVGLTITADSKSKAYGAALPALTASYSGLVNGDTPASLGTPPTLNTTATPTSTRPNSTHTITPSAASPLAASPPTRPASDLLDTDYTIGYVAGGLTVTPVGLTITADSKSKAYGAALPALTASYSGLVNGDTPASLGTPPTLNTS